jgi:hypothetical protein
MVRPAAFRPPPENTTPGRAPGPAKQDGLNKGRKNLQSQRRTPDIPLPSTPIQGNTPTQPARTNPTQLLERRQFPYPIRSVRKNVPLGG